MPTKFRFNAGRINNGKKRSKDFQKLSDAQLLIIDFLVITGQQLRSFRRLRTWVQVEFGKLFVFSLIKSCNNSFSNQRMN